MECSDESKCAATGRPGELTLIERRCSVNLSASRLFVSLYNFFSQRVHVMAHITFVEIQA